MSNPTDRMRHGFSSPFPNGPNPNKLQPTHWNQPHVVEGGTVGWVMTRDPAEPDGWKWAPGGAAGASVTSTELSVVAAAVQALSGIVSMVQSAASTETSARVAKDDSLSNAISNEMSVRGAADVILAAAVEAVSAQAASAVSQEASVRSAADAGLSVGVLQEGSVRSAADAALSGRVDSVQAGISAVSGKTTAGGSVRGLQSLVNALSSRVSQAQGSVTSVEAQAISAQAASAISHEGSVRSAADATLSGRVDSVDGRIGSLSVVFASLSIKSVGGTSVKGLNQSLFQALSNRISAAAGGGGGSVTSTEVSAGDAATSAQAASAISHEASIRSAADAALSVAIASVLVFDKTGASAIGLQTAFNAFSNILSDHFSLMIDIRDSVSAQAKSTLSVEAGIRSAADVTLSGRVDSVETHASTASAAATSVDARIASLSVIYASLSVKSVGGTSVKGLNQSLFQAISNRISAAAGGGGSVTSTEVSAGDASVAAQAASALSQALSVLSVTDAGLSGRVDSVDARVASLSAVFASLSVRSVGDVSTKGLNQSLFNALSTQISHEISVRSAADAALSGRVDSVETHASTASAAATSADAHANTASAAATSVDARVASLSVVLASLSVRSVGNVSTRGLNQSLFNALSTQISHQASVRSAADAALSGRVDSVETHASTASAAATSVDGRIGSLSVVFASLSVKSVGGTSVKGLTQSLFNALSARIPAASVGSNNASVASQAASAASHFASVASHAASVASQAASVILGDQDKGYVSVGQSISATALTNISGLSVSVSATGIYQLDGMLMINRTSADQPVRLGLTFSAMTNLRGWIGVGVSALAKFDGDASGSVIISTVSVGGLSTVAVIAAVMEASVAGVVQVQAAVSAAAAVDTYLRGSWLRVYKINTP